MSTCVIVYNVPGDSAAGSRVGGQPEGHRETALLLISTIDI